MLEPEDIRCTSIARYGLPGGARISDQIRLEVRQARIVIGLISQAGFASAWVLFELGARWATEGVLVPLLAPGVPASIIKGPLSEVRALSCDSREDLRQLIDQVAAVLEPGKGALDSYARDEMDAVLALKEELALEIDPAPVLEFLRTKPGRLFYTSVIARGAGMELAQAQIVLPRLVTEGLVKEELEKFGPVYKLLEKSGD